jgi:hypothetical protein
MRETDKVALAILMSSDLREGSWNPKTNSYELTLQGACHEATLQAGLDCSMSTLIYLLLNSNWNDAISWAKEVQNEAD